MDNLTSYDGERLVTSTVLHCRIIATIDLGFAQTRVPTQRKYHKAQLEIFNAAYHRMHNRVHRHQNRPESLLERRTNEARSEHIGMGTELYDKSSDVLDHKPHCVLTMNGYAVLGANACTIPWNCITDGCRIYSQWKIDTNMKQDTPLYIAMILASACSGVMPYKKRSTSEVGKALV